MSGLIPGSSIFLHLFLAGSIQYDESEFALEILPQKSITETFTWISCCYSD